MGRKEKMAADPQNSFWANDTSKFGRKMLERMGWAEGRGLGADGQGTATHVEVVRKADNAGIGVATEHSDNWLVHNDNLNDILAMLNEQYAPPSTSTLAATSAADSTAPPTAAAAEQRQLSGYHRMYRKRVQNKDVSRYSSADVAQILGLPPASSGAPAAKRKRPDDVTATTAADGDGDGDDARPMLGAAASADDVVQTSAHITSSVSVSDYFSSKMRLLGGFLPATTTTTTTTNDEDDKEAPSRAEQPSAAKRRAVEPAVIAARSEPTAKEARKAEKKAAKKLAKKEAKQREKKAAKKSAQVKRARG